MALPGLAATCKPTRMKSTTGADGCGEARRRKGPDNAGKKPPCFKIARVVTRSDQSCPVAGPFGRAKDARASESTHRDRAVSPAIVGRSDRIARVHEVTEEVRPPVAAKLLEPHRDPRLGAAYQVIENAVAVVSALRATFTGCYKANLLRDPRAVGRLGSASTSDRMGALGGADAQATGWLDSELARCVLSEARFEAPPGGQTDEVPSPFVRKD
jgi:hypothetical protein